MLMVAMLALSGTAFAQGVDCGNGNDFTNSGNASPSCGGKGGDNGGGGGGGAGGNGGSVTVESGAVQINPVVTGGAGGSVTGNIGGTASATVATGAVQNTVTGNSLNVAEGAVTNNNTANGGNATATGNSVVVAEGALSGGNAVVESGAVQYTYKEVEQAPSIGQGSFAIAGCSVAGNAGGSGPGWSGFLGFGFTPSQCYDFMLAQAYQSIGEKKAVCDILKASKAGQRQIKRGITLPECVPAAPEVKTVVVEVPAEPKTVYVEVPPAKISE
jgi:hypothetical protein